MGPQGPINLFGHAFDQAQFGHRGKRLVGSPVTLLSHQILAILCAVRRDGLVVGVDPVHQRIHGNCSNPQCGKQLNETISDDGIHLAIGADQVVQIKPASKVVNLDLSHTIVIQRQNGCIGGPELVKAIDHQVFFLVLVIIPAQDLAGERLGAKCDTLALLLSQIMSRLEHSQALLLGHPRSKHDHQSHGQQHHDQSNAALTIR